MVKDGRSVRVLVLVLTVLLILAIGYISYGFFTNWKQATQLGTFQQGAQYGYQQAIVQVAQQASTCQQIPLIIGNQTVNIIAVECLQSQ